MLICHSSARSATSPSNFAARTYHRGAGRYVPTSALRRSLPAVSATNSCGPSDPSSGVGRMRHSGPSFTPRASSAPRAMAAASLRPIDSEPGGSRVNTAIAHATRLAVPTPSQIVRSPIADRIPGDNRRVRRTLRRRRRRPCRVALAIRELRPASGLNAADEHDPERDERHQDDHCLLHPDAGGVGEEDRQREPDDVEREVEDDPGEQAEVQVEKPEADRRQDQLDGTRERGLRGIRRVPRAENHGLDDEGRDDEQPPMPEAIADERGAGDRHGAEQAFLPEARLQRVRDGRQPWHVRREHVRVQQGFRRRPPAERARRDQVEQDVVGEEDRHEQEPRRRLSEDRLRAARLLLPDAPELRDAIRTRAASGSPPP